MIHGVIRSILALSFLYFSASTERDDGGWTLTQLRDAVYKLKKLAVGPLGTYRNPIEMEVLWENPIELR
jgi:hypothetical protein